MSKIEQQDGPTLSPKQGEVLALLLEGETVSTAATRVGLNRRTIHGWLASDAEFIAAWNTARQDLQEAHLRRVAKLTVGAIDVVGKAIEDGDVRTSIALLRGLGILNGKPPEIGRLSAEEISDDIAQREFDQTLKLGFLRRGV